MSKRFFAAAFAAAFAVGLATVAWAGFGFIASSWLALAMTAVIAAVYLLGASELQRFRAATGGLAAALADIPQPLPDLGTWLATVPASVRAAVRLRITGERAGLPGPALTPYLVGLLVMLGMLGTFLGMVLTFKGAVFALEGSTDLQAIRSALAEPIKGLGLSFGTSVAGVAASAMLGLMAAIARRERLEVARTLDQRSAGVLQPFTLGHQRQQGFRSLQALPQVVVQLEGMMERIERRAQQLDEQLLQRHAAFQTEVTRACTELTSKVGGALERSLSDGSRAAGDSIRPVVEAAMQQIVHDTERLHERLGSVAQGQVDTLAQQFGASARAVAQHWQAALQEHARTSEALVASVQGSLARTQAEQARVEEQRLQAWATALAQNTRSGEAVAARLQDTLASFTASYGQRSTELLESVNDSLVRTRAEQARVEEQRLQAWTAALEQNARTSEAATAQLRDTLASFTACFGQRSTELLASVEESLARTQAEHARAEQLRLRAWSETLQASATELQGHWRRASDQAIAQQQGALAAVAKLLAQSEDLVRSRAEGEARWVVEHRDRMDQMAALWRSGLAALRQDEGERGQAAVARLGELETAVTRQLATLGAALEEPITRLLRTASEVPQAAAGVITQLRQEMSRAAERDNLALQERTELLERLAGLLQTVQQACGAQQAAIEGMVAAASTVMEQAEARFAQALDARVGQAAEMAAQIGAGALELGSLGEAFGHSVQLFQESNDKLTETLQRIESSLLRSTARSDEQLAYYVAQAREVIDLSIASQQGLVDNLRRLQLKPAAVLEGEQA